MEASWVPSVAGSTADIDVASWEAAWLGMSHHAASEELAWARGAAHMDNDFVAWLG